MTKIFSKEANQTTFPFVLPELPFNKNAFGELMSAETFDFHHGKHHNAYVVNLNKLLENDANLKSKDLETITKNSSGGIFNNAAQVWNHSFFWHCLSPNGGGKPQGVLLEQIEKDFGSFDQFVTDFKNAGATQFGSGWAWLVWNGSRLEVTKTANAETPITNNMHPIITCDVWEHAYYIDYRNARPNYLDQFMSKLVNWEFASNNFANATGR